MKGRLAVQQISRHDFASPGDLVRWLVAAQAQDYGAAKWALGLRLSGSPTEEAIEHAVSEGTILRTHALRWTWQFVSPADIHWLLALSAPRQVERSARRNRELDLDAATFRRSNMAIEKALRDGRHLTRDELGERLSKAGVSPAGQRLPHILARAELEGVICSGARRGKQSTYALLEHRAPHARKGFARDDALAELARRYFQSRGPATVQDFAWWSGLAQTDARNGLEAARTKLVREVTLGRTYWRGESAPLRAARSIAVLLPAFDEYLIAYRDRSAVLDATHVRRLNAGGGMLGPCVVIGGRVVGTWRRELARSKVLVEVRMFEKAPHSAQKPLIAAARRYAAFLGLEVDCRFDIPARPRPP